MGALSVWEGDQITPNVGEAPDAIAMVFIR